MLDTSDSLCTCTCMLRHELRSMQGHVDTNDSPWTYMLDTGDRPCVDTLRHERQYMNVHVGHGQQAMNANVRYTCTMYVHVNIHVVCDISDTQSANLTFDIDFFTKTVNHTQTCYYRPKLMSKVFAQSFRSLRFWTRIKCAKLQLNALLKANDYEELP